MKTREQLRAELYSYSTPQFAACGAVLRESVELSIPALADGLRLFSAPSSFGLLLDLTGYSAEHFGADLGRDSENFIPETFAAALAEACASLPEFDAWVDGLGDAVECEL